MREREKENRVFITAGLKATATSEINSKKIELLLCELVRVVVVVITLRIWLQVQTLIMPPLLLNFQIFHHTYQMNAIPNHTLLKRVIYIPE